MKPSPRQQHWAQHIETWRSSDLSQNAYCRERHLKPHQFSYWKRKLALLNTEHTSKPSSTTTAFIPLTMADTSATTNGLRIRLPNGCELSGIEAQHLPVLKPLLEVLL